MKKDFKKTQKRCKKNLKKSLFRLIFAGVFIAVLFLACGCSNQKCAEKTVQSKNSYICEGAYDVEPFIDIDKDTVIVKISGKNLAYSNIWENFYVPENKIPNEIMQFFLSDEYLPPFIMTVEKYSDGDFDVSFDFISQEEYQKRI